MPEEKKIVDHLIQSKKVENIRSMFDEVAPRYDFMNHFLSMGIDYWWRRKVVNHITKKKPMNSFYQFLDVATGTGDLLIASQSRYSLSEFTGIDISEKMLEIARKKIQKKGRSATFILGAAESLPFANDTYDVITAGFGVRNFEDLPKGLSEFHRILKPSGMAVIIEPMIPRHSLLKGVYMFYFKHILPLFGKMISKSSYAYSYFSSSVMAFPQEESFTKLLHQAGFSEIYYETQTFQTAIIYVAIK